MKLKKDTFHGVFDGQNHIIYNCFMNRNYTNEESKYQISFFGGILNGEVKNLKLENINYKLTNKDNSCAVVGIAGRLTPTGKISNCYVSGRIEQVSYGKGNVNCAGLVVYNLGIIENCYNLTNISGKLENDQKQASCYLGGLVTNQEGDYYIENCYNKGKIEGKGCGNKFQLGGLARTMSGNGEIRKSFNAGELRLDIEGANYSCIGGILGTSQNKTTIKNVYNVGKIKCNGISSIYLRVGGCIGDVSNELDFINGYSTGNIEIIDISPNDLIGSIFGVTSAKSNIQNIYYKKKYNL